MREEYLSGNYSSRIKHVMVLVALKSLLCKIVYYIFRLRAKCFFSQIAIIYLVFSGRIRMRVALKFEHISQLYTSVISLDHLWPAPRKLALDSEMYRYVYKFYFRSHLTSFYNDWVIKEEIVSCF